MTICVSVKVAEGLVLAADSTVMLEGTASTPQGMQSGILQSFEHANKVTQVGDYPIGVLTWGLGAIEARTLQSLVMEHEYALLRRADNANYDVRGIADGILSFVRARYDAAFPAGGARPVLGMLAGGYSDGQFFPHTYVCELPRQHDWEEVHPDGPAGPSFGAAWWGQTDALTRLIRGFHPPAMEELVKRGADAKIVQQWMDEGVSSLPLVFDGMPIQDAVDFASFAVQLTIGRFRFGLGPALCGGNVDIAVITPRAFHWAQRKPWSVSE